MISYLSFLIASCWHLETMSYFSFSMVVNKVRESFLLHTEKRTCFIYSDSLLSMCLIFGHVFIFIVTLRHITNTYLHYHPGHPPHSVYSYVMLCCYYMARAFTSFHLVLLLLSCWWVMRHTVSWLLSRTLSVWPGQTLTWSHLNRGLPLLAAVAVQMMWWNLISI